MRRHTSTAIPPALVVAALCTLALLSLLALAGCGGGGDGQAGDLPGAHRDLRALVKAERSFAAESVKLGYRAAFLGWLADDAVLFRPKIVAGRSYMERSPAKAGAVLDWQPAFAAVARSGDLGYTTGPWTWRNSPQDTVDTWGEFITVWRKLPDGRWRVLADLGVPHAKPSGPPPAVSYPGDGRYEAPRGVADGTGGREADVRAAEEAFDARAAAAGVEAAYLQYGAPTLRFYRTGTGAVIGPQAAAASAKQMDAIVKTIRPLGARISRAGDLGCVWGETDGTTGSGKPGLCSWLRVWNRGADGQWKVVLDVSLIIPLDPDRE